MTANPNYRTRPPEATRPEPKEPTPPFSREAEEAVIGSILLDRDTILQVAPVVVAADFFDATLGHIYTAISRLWLERKPPDLLTVTEELKALGKYGDGDGQVKSGELIRLMRAVPTAVHARYYAEIVRQHSLKRQLIRFAGNAFNLGYSPDKKAGDLLAEVSGRLQELVAAASSGDADYYLSHTKSLDYLDRFTMPKAEADPWNEAKQVRLGFGFAELDGIPGFEEPSMIMRPTNTVIVAADTSVGKTIFAEQVAEYNASQGASVLFFHNEDDHDTLLRRRMARYTGISFIRLDMLENGDGQPSASESAAIAKASGEIGAWKGHLDYAFCPGWNAERIYEEARVRDSAQLAATGKHLELIVVDWLQNMGDPAGRNRFNGAEVVEANMKTLKQLANELHTVVLVTSQVSRSGNSDEIIKPTLHNGLNGGSIERFAKWFIGLYRPSPTSNEAELLALKGSGGARGWSKPLGFVGKSFKFVSLVED